MERIPDGKLKPAIFQFHQPCDLVVPIDMGVIGKGMNWCFTNGYGCYAIRNTPVVMGSRAISELNEENNYGYLIHNNFTSSEFPNSFIFGSGSCLDQVNKPCHSYDSFSLRENNMAAFFAEQISITTICDPDYATDIPMKPIKDRIEIFPNPVRDQLTISNNGAEPVLYQLTNLHGQTLLKGNIAGNNTLQIKLADLPKGLYFIRVFDRNNEVFTRKIITY